LLFDIVGLFGGMCGRRFCAVLAAWDCKERAHSLKRDVDWLRLVLVWGALAGWPGLGLGVVDRRLCVFWVLECFALRFSAPGLAGFVKRSAGVGVGDCDARSIQHESLILAQNERWRQA
jgi:hypothetical protein